MDANQSETIGGDHDLALSMCGCGFLGVYHCGVAKCLMTHAPSVLARCKRFTGASAGALVAALLVCCRDSIDDIVAMVLGVADHVRSLKYGLLTSSFSLSDKVFEEMDHHLPENAHELATGKLFISMTERSTFESRLESIFESREKLLKCLVATSFIPFFSGYDKKPPEIDGKAYFDGGISLNLPIFPDMRTITISPFHTVGADISPVDDKPYFDRVVTVGKQKLKLSYSNMIRGKQALFPPPADILCQYKTRGFVDTMIFLKKHGVFEWPEGTRV